MEKASEIKKILNINSVPVRLNLELHRKVTDLLFEAAAQADRISQDDKLPAEVREYLGEAEKKLVSVGLNFISARLQQEKAGYLCFHTNMNTLIKFAQFLKEANNILI